LTKVATLANVIDLFSIVPIPLLEKVRWQEIALSTIRTSSTRFR
jgi:hypothetical protein